MNNVNAGILGTGRAYPEGVLTNADLEKMVETSDEWITSRTGIKQRHKAAEGEYTSMFAVRAGRQAIERAKIDPSEIDLLICATVTPESFAAGAHFYKMRGNELFKIAVRSMADVAREVLEETGYKADDVKLFIPHQANQRITDAVANNLKVDSGIVYSNIAMHGNTSSASIPIALDECVEMGR